MKKYETFEHIKHDNLRAYNRAVMFFNLYEDEGRNIAGEYAELFSEKERFMMGVILTGVRKYGKTKVLEQITKDIEFEYDPKYDSWEEQEEAKIHG